MSRDDVIPWSCVAPLQHDRVVVRRQSRPVSKVHGIGDVRRTVDPSEVKVDVGPNLKDRTRLPEDAQVQARHADVRLVGADVADTSAFVRRRLGASLVAEPVGRRRGGRSEVGAEAEAAFGQSGVAVLPLLTGGQAGGWAEVVRVVGAG